MVSQRHEWTVCNLSSCWLYYFSSLPSLSSLTVNLAVFISPDMLYATTGDTVNITASIHAISPITTVKWYRNGTLLEPESDNRYSASSDSSQALLTIHSFNEEQMGEFMVVVMDNEDRTVSAAVDVRFPGRVT